MEKIGVMYMKLLTLSDHQICATFIALALLLLFAHVFGTLLEKLKGPRVVGEILGGMILGGSCLFILLPETMNRVFFAYPEQGQVLNIFYRRDRTSDAGLDPVHSIIQKQLYRFCRERAFFFTRILHRRCDHLHPCHIQNLL